MNEDNAKDWLSDRQGVSRETFQRLEAFVQLLVSESSQQNLISKSTISSIWSRHIVDSAQLLSHLPKEADGNWLDLGSGAGFPGLVIASLTDRHVTLVESRGRRVDFLKCAAEILSLQDRLSIVGTPIERMETQVFSVISARAFAPLPRLFSLASRFSTDNTVWLLPKGRNANKEWSAAQAVWAGDFRIEPSVTDAESGILVGRLFAKKAVEQ